MTNECCNPEYIGEILKLREQSIVPDKQPVRTVPNPVYTTLETKILPECLHDDIINRRTNKIINVIQCNSTWFNKVYQLYVSLKLANEQAGRGRKGCCHVLRWATRDGTKVISFNNLLNLNRYKVRYYKTSHLHYFITLVLTTYKKMEKAKNFIASNKNYPYQQLIHSNMSSFKFLDSNNKSQNRTINLKANCPCYNKMDYINWLKYRKIINNNYKNNNSCNTNDPNCSTSYTHL